MKCYYCNKDIQEQLPFCDKCCKPLITCPNPDCKMYSNPLADLCSHCHTFLGDVKVPEHESSTSIQLSDLLNPNIDPPISLEMKYLNGEFNTGPLIAMGYLFAFQRSGHIRVINPYTLDEYNVPSIDYMVEIKYKPIFVQVIQQSDRKKLRNNYLCIASSDEILLLSMGYLSNDNPVVFKNYKNWKVDGQCQTAPVYTKDNIVIGTNQGVIAYNLDGEKRWEYNLHESSSDKNILTQFATDRDKILFGSFTTVHFF